jgi:hypothetical protein
LIYKQGFLCIYIVADDVKRMTGQLRNLTEAGQYSQTQSNRLAGAWDLFGLKFTMFVISGAGVRSLQPADGMIIALGTPGFNSGFLRTNAEHLIGT